MNTVLLTSAPDGSTTSKMKPSRQGVDSSTPGNDASDFAGVLANQAVPQPQNNATPAAGTTTAAASSSDAAKPAPSQGHDAPEQAGLRSRSGDANHSAGADPARHGRVRLAHDLHAGLLDSSASAGRDTAFNGVENSDESTLPQRFAQIIAAMEKTAGRHTAQHMDGKSADAQHAGSVKAEAGATPTDARSRLTAGNDRPETGVPGSQTGKRNPVQRTDIGNASQPSFGEGRISMDRIAGDADKVAFTLNESAHVSESRPGSAMQSAIASPDSILNVTAAPGFSMTSGPQQGADVMATSATISQPLFSKQWAPEMGRQFISLIRPGDNGNHIAELRLDPPELGPLRVTININDSVVQAMFTSAHANVRSAVEQALPQLQQQLEQEGLSLGQTSVGHDDTSQAHPEFANAGTPGSRHEPEVSTAATPVHPRVSDALVDTFA